MSGILIKVLEPSINENSFFENANNHILLQNREGTKSVIENK